MPSVEFHIGMVTIDCRDPQALAGFWAAATGAPIVADYGMFVMVGSSPRMGFQQVPDPTPGKNRLHLDGGGGDRRAQVERLVGLGATEGDTHAMGDFTWTVMADPEGNVFCVGDGQS
ncbi:MAG TPA: VOC family protein [Phycicoccus sp.]|nr:VOC family protein [Phycicoccus sp.]